MNKLLKTGAVATTKFTPTTPGSLSSAPACGKLGLYSTGAGLTRIEKQGMGNSYPLRLQALGLISQTMFASPNERGELHVTRIQTKGAR